MVLSELLASVVKAQDDLRAGLGETVVIIGSGLIGCLHAMIARLHGAANIVMADLNRGRLELCRNFGTHFVVSSEEDLVARVMEITGGRGADVCISANLFGVPIFLECVLIEPELAHKAVRKMTDHILQVAEYFIDVFGPGRVLARAVSPTESNALISPQIMEEFSLPYVTELNRKVLDRGGKELLPPHVRRPQPEPSALVQGAFLP